MKATDLLGFVEGATRSMSAAFKGKSFADGMKHVGGVAARAMGFDSLGAAGRSVMGGRFKEAAGIMDRWRGGGMIGPSAHSTIKLGHYATARSLAMKGLAFGATAGIGAAFAKHPKNRRHAQRLVNQLLG